MIHLSLLYLRSFFILMLNQFLFRQSISLINKYLFGDNLATVDKQGAEVSIEGGRHRLLGALPGFNQNNPHYLTLRNVLYTFHFESTILSLTWPLPC